MTPVIGRDDYYWAGLLCILRVVFIPNKYRGWSTPTMPCQEC
jgi:hypothetical protein